MMAASNFFGNALILGVVPWGKSCAVSHLPACPDESVGVVLVGTSWLMPQNRKTKNNQNRLVER